MAVRKTSGTGATGGVVYDLARGRTAVTAAEPQARTDSAGITPEARELSSALHAVETSDEVRAEKVPWRSCSALPRFSPRLRPGLTCSRTSASAG